MTEPVGIVLGILGLTGTCLEVIEFGFKAADRKEDFEDLSIQLQFEQIFIGHWAENVGIFNRELGKTKAFPFSYCQLIGRTLERIIGLFHESSHLVSRYEEKFKSVPIINVADEEDNICRKIIRSVKERDVPRPRAFRWAIRDGSRLEKLVGRVSSLRRALCELLPEDIHLVERQMLRDKVTVSTPGIMENLKLAAAQMGQRSASDFEIMSAIESAVTVREALPIWKTNEEVEGDALIETHFLRDARFPHQALPVDLARWQGCIQSNQIDFGTRSVIVEWRCSSSYQGPNAEMQLRIDVVQLATLLNAVHGRLNYHIPKFIGYFQDEKFHLGCRYGLVFESPLHHRQIPQQSPLTSLYEAISTNEHPPELGLRFRLAREIATSVYYILSTGWMHKAIRSSNIVLFNKNENENEAQSPDSILKNPDFALLGFGFSRPDRRGEASIKENDSSLDLYRHSNCVSRAWNTQEYQERGYQKLYDLYSLGVVLAEIGMWRTAASLNESRRRRFANQEFSIYLQQKASAELPLSMGQIYSDAVHICLSSQFNITQADPHGRQLLDRFDGMVLQPLGICSA
ncbi:hypothetical protein ASPWEDRAFT_172181 [Aspergillus wentii DTO 134E9]|uniref:Prion-inhibition and propagation HeLo domain-containing protein n=1 Tax=Aspergillus wentii DTO 134E9 TaxID=1073089 RepID=A0A1L9RKB5_ASPWE|nr:uncharacterized protein ASPWEDRAFT_172181 [Aspergillus wentii DTO 134E9]KAI9924856.1 hypothetical protein MW887_006713 [Aspergillus wentii]OJJ35370.1 hypothetical protein ASPWEDRAFT_172181 [Aspergillus wentii DTO 134E9]